MWAQFQLDLTIGDLGTECDGQPTIEWTSGENNATHAQLGWC